MDGGKEEPCANTTVKASKGYNETLASSPAGAAQKKANSSWQQRFKQKELDIVPGLLVYGILTAIQMHSDVETEGLDNTTVTIELLRHFAKPLFLRKRKHADRKLFKDLAK
ncbi:MAG: hypothetical protein ACKPKO_09980 [Candidatus Fonsibacter sp.]